MINSEDIFSQGFAIPGYDVYTNTRTWRFRGEDFKLPANAVRLYDYPGVSFQVGKIEDIRKAAK